MTSHHKDDGPEKGSCGGASYLGKATVLSLKAARSWAFQQGTECDDGRGEGFAQTCLKARKGEDGALKWLQKQLLAGALVVLEQLRWGEPSIKDGC